jgi:hypothetical protein
LGWVEVSFNYSIMASISSIRASSFLAISSCVRTVVAISVIYDCGAVALVVRCWDVISKFALSSCLVILATRSSTTFSRCRILDFYSLLMASWSTTSSYRRWISACSSLIVLLHLFSSSSCSSLHSTVDSPSNRTFSSRELPAPCTCLMVAVTSSFHFLSSALCYRRLVV